MSAGLLSERVAVVTGAGRGIGREIALTLAAAGARVVVNDLGAGPDGTGHQASPAEQVVKEICVFSQHRPTRAIHHAEGWTPERLLDPLV